MKKATRLALFALVVVVCCVGANAAVAVYPPFEIRTKSCRMGWYDPQHEIPHWTMAEPYVVWFWQDEPTDPCDGFPPCGSPETCGAGCKPCTRESGTP